jgi:hypothetical protein
MRKIPKITEIRDQVDPGMRLIEHDIRRSLSFFSVALGNLRKLPSKDKSAVGESVTMQSKRNHRKLRIVINIAFNLFFQQVLQFELNLQQITRQWTGMPKFDCSMTVFNVRPNDAPIFDACRKWDIVRVRYLLGSGQASLYDVSDKLGGGLLEVRIPQANK